MSMKTSPGGLSVSFVGVQFKCFLLATHLKEWELVCSLEKQTSVTGTALMETVLYKWNENTAIFYWFSLIGISIYFLIRFCDGISVKRLRNFNNLLAKNTGIIFLVILPEWWFVLFVGRCSQYVRLQIINVRWNATVIKWMLTFHIINANKNYFTDLSCIFSNIPSS